MDVVAFSLFPQIVYGSNLSLIGRGLDCLEFRSFVFSFYRFCQLLAATSSASLSETCLFRLWPLLVTTVAGASATVAKEQRLRSEIGSGCSSSDDGSFFAVSLEVAACAYRTTKFRSFLKTITFRF